MKLVSGRPLRDLIAERTTVDQRIGLLHHVIAVADAIAYAHGRNIIHRDLKPANVIVGDFGETVVIDWGLAKDLTASDDSLPGGASDSASPQHDRDLTSTGSVLGTPAYMAPEQERGEPVDQRADVFAIGAMLWELCALQKVPPTDKRHRHRLLRRAGIDRDLVTILDKALDPSPALRYSHAGALAADLKAFKSGARIAARNYSLFAMLGHWTRRHRALALAITAVVAVIAVGGAAYVRNIAAEQERADLALADARQQARRAVIANATSLLESDPTEAWSVLSSLDDSSAETTVLRARIRAAGIADATISLPARLFQLDLTPSGRQLAVALNDRTLHVIDLQRQTIRRLADSLAEPPNISVTETAVYTFRKTERLTLTRVSLTSGAVDDLVELPKLPDALFAGDAGVFWQSPDGAVHQLVGDHAERIVGTGITQFALVGSQIAMCDASHRLRIGEPGREPAALGPCVETWHWDTSADSFVVPADDGHVAIYHQGNVRYAALEQARNTRQLALSKTGLISTFDAAGNVALLLPGATSFQRVRVGEGVIETAAHGSTIFWLFRDGRLKALDTSTQREWSMRAHVGRLICVRALPPGNRAVTCGSNEIRVWTLPNDAPVQALELPTAGFDLVFRRDGMALFDSATGDAYMMSPGERRFRFLHKHTSQALVAMAGAAWCDDRACTGSWDGTILCSSEDAKTTDVIAHYDAPIRSLSSGQGHCFAAVADGGIYDLRSPQAPAYRHRREPYRAVVSPDGARVASGDWEGAVKIWDTTRQRITAELPQLHRARVSGIVWLDGDQLATGGLDGMVYLLNTTLEIVQSWRVGVPVQQIQASSQVIHAMLTDGTLWSVSLATGTEYRISLGGVSTSLAVSPHGTAAVGTDRGELILVDTDRRIATHNFKPGSVNCAAFQDAETLLACVPGGRIMRIHIDEEHRP
jgi:WD40 repeat protein